MPSAKQRQADRFGDLLLEQAAGPLSLAEEAAAAEASLLRMPGAVLIPIERLAANPDNPRHRLGNVEELALSLADRGALQALLVRRDLERPGYYLVVAGNRRLAAAQLIRAGAIDDAVDLVAVHGVGGLAGAMLAAPLIAGTLGGTGYAPGMGPVRQILAQAVAVGIVAGWSAIGTAIAALTVAMVVPMRIGAEDEAGASGE